VLTDIYPAGESPIAGVDSDSLSRAITLPGSAKVLRNHQMANLPDELLAMLRDGDVLITMGAGSIGAVPGQLVNRTGTLPA
jgi:UDP-N-acetylmuramate--alanine ligase